MALVLVINFGILAFLKYYNFFSGSINDIMGCFGIGFSAPTVKLFLPLGISFYTFQSMGYIVDVYRDKTAAEKNPLKLALFVSVARLQNSQLLHQNYNRKKPKKTDNLL